MSRSGISCPDKFYCMFCVDRSSGDDAYCPPHQVDFIQASVIDMLQTVYGDLDIKLNYTVDSEHS